MAAMLKSPDHGKKEKQIQAEVFAMIASEFQRDAVVFRNNVGTWNDGTSFVRYGLAVGSPDLVCILRGSIFVGIECKTLNGRITKDQENWKNCLCPRLGIHHIIAKGTQTESAADVAKREISDILKIRG
jgi:hypothetical protein